MRVAVFTPTNRWGGLDVLEASIARQTRKPDLWLIGDELLQKRLNVYRPIADRLQISLEVFKPKQPIRNPARNLVAAYNNAAETVVKEFNNEDLFISLQDYIWIPENGIERMVEVFQDNRQDLITGVTHISLDPFPTQVVDREGEYTIFSEPYTDKPKRIGWHDVRVTEIYRRQAKENPFQVENGHWEANWAALPVKYLMDGMRWSEIFDTGYAMENMDFAQKCVSEYGCRVIMDPQNEAISLPHREYFQWEQEDLIKYNNRELYDRIWN